jgi:Lon protease-like protein
MVSQCVQNDAPFGVLLIRDGKETGPSTTHNVGTLARITDWYQGSDGLLGITAIGEERFRLISTTRQDDGLHIGEIQLLQNEPNMPLPAEYQEMAGILAGVLDDLGRLYEPLEKRFDDASWVTSRFVEILPIDLEEKQRCLEQCDPIERLRIVRDLLAAGRG